MPIESLNTPAPFMGMPMVSRPERDEYDRTGPPAPPFERGLKGLSATATPDERSVHPDSRSLLPGAQSDTDSDRKVEVVLKNRSEAFDEVGHATVDGHPGNAILTGLDSGQGPGNRTTDGFYSFRCNLPFNTAAYMM